MSKMPCKPVIAIATGMEHSGTTYLTNLMTLHPKIKAGFECGLLLGETPSDFPNHQPFYNWMIGTEPSHWQIQIEKMKEVCMAETWEQAYQEILDHSPIFPDNSFFLLDKTPAYIKQLDTILGKINNTPCVVIKKNILLQYYSYQKRGWSLKSFEEYYTNSTKSFNNARKKFRDRILIVDHKLLSQNTCSEMERIFNFIGISDTNSFDMEEKIQRLNTHYFTRPDGHAEYSYDLEVENANKNVSSPEKECLKKLPVYE